MQEHHLVDQEMSSPMGACGCSHGMLIGSALGVICDIWDNGVPPLAGVLLLLLLEPGPTSCCVIKLSRKSVSDLLVFTVPMWNLVFLLLLLWVCWTAWLIRRFHVFIGVVGSGCVVCAVESSSSPISITSSAALSSSLLTFDGGPSVRPLWSGRGMAKGWDGEPICRIGGWVAFGGLENKFLFLFKPSPSTPSRRHYWFSSTPPRWR